MLSSMNLLCFLYEALYREYIGIMEKKMETTILWGYIGIIYRDNGK